MNPNFVFASKGKRWKGLSGLPESLQPRSAVFYFLVLSTGIQLQGQRVFAILKQGHKQQGYTLWKFKANHTTILLKKFFFQCLFIFEREKECKLGRSRETEGDRRSKAGSALSAQSQCQSRTKDLWDHDLRWSQMLNPLSQPGGPTLQFKSSYNPGFDMARIRSFWPLSICWYLKKHFQWKHLKHNFGCCFLLGFWNSLSGQKKKNTIDNSKVKGHRCAISYCARPKLGHI